MLVIIAEQEIAPINTMDKVLYFIQKMAYLDIVQSIY